MKQQVKLMKGDNMESLKKLPDNSIDSIVSDPPYALTSIKKRFGKEGSAPAQFGTDGAFQRASKGFMGKEWDAEVPTVEFWREVYRVLKPGGHVLSFGGTRTYHRMAVNIEDAGFEIRDQVMWLYGSGFPKSHNIGKAVDKIEGNEREVVGIKENWHELKGTDDRFYVDKRVDLPITKGTSPYEGWGTSLKPANEPICVARKPLSEKTIAENVIKWGTGGINIDGCRVGNETISTHNAPKGTFAGGELERGSDTNSYTEHEGRFPANIILDETAAELLDLQSGVSTTKSNLNYKHNKTESDSDVFQSRGTYTPRDDKGGASRFFYVAKVSKKERNMGLDGFEEITSGGKGHGLDRRCSHCNTSMLKPDDCKCETPDWITPPKKNTHPTLKPINLMTYLCRLVTPEGGIVCDPFMGSGSTGIAACLEGFRFIGMEMDEDYFKIAEARIGAYEEYRKLLQPTQKLVNGNKRMASRASESNSLGLGITKPKK